MNTSSPTPPRSPLPSRIAGNGTTTGRAPDARQTDVHRRVVHALATRPPVTGVVVLEYGLRYAATAFRHGTKWALYFVSAALVCCCAVIGSPGMFQMLHGNTQDDLVRAPPPPAAAQALARTPVPAAPAPSAPKVRDAA